LPCLDFVLLKFCLVLDFAFVLKGRGFSRAVSIAKSAPALAADGRCVLQSAFSAAAQRSHPFDPFSNPHLE
jgi:hypothetical protein